MRKCPNCGNENGDNYKFCFECGFRFEEVHQKAAEEFAEEFAEESVTQPEPIKEDDIKTTDIAPQTDDFDEEKPKKRKHDEDRFDFTPDEEDKPAKRTRSREPIPREDDNAKSGDGIFIVFVILLIAIILGLGYLYIDRNFPGDTLKEKFNYMKNTAFSDKIITAAPTITDSETADGEPAIMITVYARKGCVVTFKEGATEMEQTIKGQSISFRVPTSLWTENVPEDAIGSVEIVPNVFVRDPNGSNEVIQLEFEPYRIKLEEVKIELTNPETLELTTSSSTVEIEGNVSDTDVAVFMNGEQLQLDEQGYFRTIYHVSQLGEQEVVFTAQKRGYAVGKTVLKVNYTKSDINFEVTSETLRTFENTIDIKGKIEKGAGMKVSGVELKGKLKLQKNGEFEFTAKVPSVGNYTITITLTAGDTTSTVDIYAEHAPAMDEYISGAWQFDYEYIEGHKTLDKHYGITGKITEVYYEEPYVKAKMHTDQGDIIIVYYNTSTTKVEANDGKTYRIYGNYDSDDTETGLMQFYIWFIYKS